MKNLFRMSFLALLITGSVACKKEDSNDDNNNPNTTNNGSTAEKVEGTWKMTEINQSGETKANGQVYSTHTSTGSNFTGSLTFKSDNTYNGDLGYDATIITTAFGSTDTTTTTLSGFLASGTWKINSSGNLEVESNGEKNEVEIISASNKKLVLYMETEQTQTQGGVTATSSIDVNFVLEK